MQPESTQSISRSSSMISIESSISSDDADSITGTRRTRKRFTDVQLMMLENLFHHNSHPSRQERETVAKAGNMEVKSVTIWFQNRRQIERKGSGTTSVRPSRSSPSSTPYSVAPASTQPLSARLSLDQIASRAERPQSSPRTPTRRRRDPTRPIWEAMPSSPPAAVLSPPAKDFVEFGKFKRTRTLEWACARSRLAVKAGETIPEGGDDHLAVILEHRPVLMRTRSNTSTASTLSDKEDDRKRVRDNAANGTTYPGVEDDMLKAALALCGLGRS